MVVVSSPSASGDLFPLAFLSFPPRDRFLLARTIDPLTDSGLFFIPLAVTFL